MNEPTPEQCTAVEKVFEDEDTNGYAMWFPQLGGYHGRAIALIDKSWIEYDTSFQGGCVDIWLWHNGEFPLHEGQNPAVLHLCDPQQFIDFGTKLKELNDKGKIRVYR